MSNISYVKKLFNKQKFVNIIVKRLDRIPLIDIDRINNELNVMHKSRMSRNLDYDSLSFSIEDILKAILENQAFRSRFVEIFMNLQEITTTYSRLLSFLEDYTINEIPSDIGIRSDRAKIGLCRLMFKKYYNIKMELESMLSRVESLIEDVDKIHFDLDTVAKIKVQIIDKEKYI